MPAKRLPLGAKPARVLLLFLMSAYSGLAVSAESASDWVIDRSNGQFGVSDSAEFSNRGDSQAYQLVLARRLGQAGRKSVETSYNWDRVIRDLREIESQVV